MEERRHRRADHAHRIGPAPATSWAPPPRPIGNLRIQSSRRASGPRPLWLTIVAALALLGVIVVAATSGGSPRPNGGNPSPAPTTVATSGAVAVVSRASMGPHGDDVPAWETDPPMGRSAWPPSRPTPPFLLTGYRWPLDHSRITNAFGAGHPGSFIVNGKTFHEGIDLSTFCGDHVTAAHDGVVLAAGRHDDAFIGWIGDVDAYRANLTAARAWRTRAIAVVIDDGNGYRSIYLHFNLVTVKVGDVVHAGDMLGYEGSTGYATGCHLHYGLFSPLETATFRLDPSLVNRYDMPSKVLARIDPLLVLPPLSAGSITWSWGEGPQD